MLWRTLLSLLLICCVIFCGCSKKKKADEAAEQAEIESVATGGESDDIFDEFYDDDEKKAEETATQEDYTSPSSTPQFNPDGRYVVQVSCVLSKALAQDVVSKLESKGYPAYIAEVDNPTPELIGTYQRIRIGGFTGVSLAKDFAEGYLTPEGYEYWVDNRSNDNVGMGGYEGLGQSSGGGYESGYTSEPAQTAPAEDWSTSQPEPATQATTEEWGTTETTTPETEPTPTPEVAAPVTPEPTAPQTTPETGTATAEEEWGEAEDEWGADTSGW